MISPILFPSPSSVPRWLTICLQWLLFQQIHYHGSESRIMPLRGIELFLKHARKPSLHGQQLLRHGVWPICGPNCAAYIAHSFPGTLGLFCRTRRLPPHMNSEHLPSSDFTAAELSGTKITISLTSRSFLERKPLRRQRSPPSEPLP